MEDADSNKTLIVGTTRQGAEIHATPVRLARHSVVFDLYALGGILQTSELLDDFKILVNDQTIYSGRAVVKSLVDAGATCVCEATLEDGWIDVKGLTAGGVNGALGEQFNRFFCQWQKDFKVLPEYKVLAADMRTFLTDLRLWIEQVELGIRAAPSGDRSEMEHEAGATLSEAVFPPIDMMFEKYEELAGRIEPELQPVHRSYIRRQIHSLVLCSPFAYRTVRKPLGYAGDYEMVNMLLRDPHEGPSLFGKVLNRWFIKQPPAEAHRNRIAYLARTLEEETLRLARRGKPLRVLNLGCGPSQEIQNFLATSELSNQTQFTLLDFNEETLKFATRTLEDLKLSHHRSTQFEFIRKSVGQVLKGRGKKVEANGASRYDFVYCAGLFDYLPDNICRQLTTLLYDLVAPGGLLVATNVDSSNPIRNWLGDILEWHLIYRNARQFTALRPEGATLDDVRIVADVTGVNIFLEARKPNA